MPRWPIATAALALAIHAAAAQSPPSGPPNFSEGTEIERRLPDPPGAARPQPAPPVLLPPSVTPPAPETSETFVIAAVVVEGATIFRTEEFVPFYSDLLARPVSRRDLAAITEAITNHYYAAGYTLTRAYIPPQDVEAGVVTVVVAEGFIERVTFANAPTVPDIARRYVDVITAERPLNRATLERQLLLLGDLFGMRVDDARLRPIDAGTGRYELVVDLRQRSLDYYGYLDNRGTRSNGPLQLWNSGGLNVVGNAAWRAQAGFFTVPNSPREVLYLQAGLARSLGDDGTVIRSTVSGSRNIAGPPGNSSDTETSSRRFQLGLSHPFWRRRDVSLWGNLNFDALHSREERFQRLSFEDELRVLRPGVYLYARDDWGGENGVNLESSFGLTTLGASPSGPERSRSDADTSFRKLRLDGWRSQGLFGNWSLYGQGAAQTSNKPLLSAEEFSLGGPRFGRGYDPALIAGDRGVAGAIELRFGEPLTGPFVDYQLYSFYDVGRISNGTVDNNARRRLASAGLGARVTLEPAIRLNLEIAKPLNAVEGREDRDLRSFVTLSAEF